MFGYLDEVSTSLIRGWAVDEAGSAPRLNVLVNGYLRLRFTPSLVRPDLTQRYGNATLAFDIALEVREGSEIAVVSDKGQHLNGSPVRAERARLSNLQCLLAPLKRSMRILEIGAGHRPTAPRSAGWDSFCLDRATQEELRAKYQEHPEGARIEPVDFVWRDGSLDSAVPASDWGSFDACIASHMIGRMPNPIAFYNSIDRLLSADGTLLLIVPDKRFTFDFFKPVSTTSQMLEAERLRRTRHSKGTAFDDVCLNCNLGGWSTWNNGTPLNGLSINSPLQEGLEWYEKTDESEAAPYTDFQGWVFTPSSFQINLLELNALGIIPFVVTRAYPTFGCEFYIELRRGKVDPATLEDRRLELYKQTILELGEQADALRRTG